MQNDKMDKIKDLRGRTQASYAECKKALVENDFDVKNAEEALMKKGMRAADAPTRNNNVGAIYSYLHPGNRIGVLVEVKCDTDFVAKTAEFTKFVKEVALQVASMKPIFVSRADVGEDTLDRERIRRAQTLLIENTDFSLLNEKVDAEMTQWFSEVCLLEQTYIRDTGKLIKELLAELVNKTGEACRISRFSRWEVGVD